MGVGAIQVSLPRNVQYVLVSSPEHDLKGHSVLAVAKSLVYLCGGTNKAGDANDSFYSMMMGKAEMDVAAQGRRIVWKSLICAYLMDLKRLFPDDEIRLLTIDGGPECAWELDQLRNDIKKAYPYYKLRRFRDLDAFEDYFIGGGP